MPRVAPRFPVLHADGQRYQHHHLLDVLPVSRICWKKGFLPVRCLLEKGFPICMCYCEWMVEHFHVILDRGFPGRRGARAWGDEGKTPPLVGVVLVSYLWDTGVSWVDGGGRGRNPLAVTPTSSFDRILQTRTHTEYQGMFLDCILPRVEQS